MFDFHGYWYSKTGSDRSRLVGFWGHVYCRSLQHFNLNDSSIFLPCISTSYFHFANPFLRNVKLLSKHIWESRYKCTKAGVVLNYNNKCLCFNNRLVVSWLKQRIFSTQEFDTAPNIQMENQSIPSQISMYFHHPKIGQLFLGLCLYSKKHV